uniref:Anion exchange protein n=1 Tax=Laticauda laticaudata TaxID=8630 RepID=A0A8C5WXL9_LATLA
MNKILDQGNTADIIYLDFSKSFAKTTACCSPDWFSCCTFTTLVFSHVKREEPRTAAAFYSPALPPWTDSFALGGKKMGSQGRSFRQNLTAGSFSAALPYGWPSTCSHSLSNRSELQWHRKKWLLPSTSFWPLQHPPGPRIQFRLLASGICFGFLPLSPGMLLSSPWTVLVTKASQDKSDGKERFSSSEKYFFSLQLRNKFMKKIPKNAEASNVLVGEVDFLDKPLVTFVRLTQPTMLGGMTEVPIPTRFLFILLGPSGKAKSYNEIGPLPSVPLEDLIAGLDEFLDEVTVLPPGGWDPKVRIEPPKKVPSAEKRPAFPSLERRSLPAYNPHRSIPALMVWPVFCGGLYLDLKRKLPWFFSDFYDGFHIQSISAVLFIYLGCIANAITFGGLLGDATDNYQGVMESFLGTAIAGSAFCLLAGQPLIILSSTGPILIFEKLLYDFSKGNSIDYLEFRLWIGLHSAAQCLILVATDASFIIKYITRFTEEGFSTLISFIFIYDAMKKMIGAFKVYPINIDYNPDYVTMYKCECIAPDAGKSWLPKELSAKLKDKKDKYNKWKEGKKECLRYGGSLVGTSCKFVPDLALMSFILFFGTYSMTLTLKKFKFSRYFPTKFRKLISDFSIFMSILMFVGLDVLCGLNTPKLQVPTEFKPTRLDRGWFVFPFGKNPWWVYLASALPALLVTILIFMDQQITAVIVNRKEHKLKKAAGYHLDLFWVGVLLAVCSFMGLPWYVAATVISIAHIDSLKMETETSAPGEQPEFLGVREQRVTGIIVFILIGISVFLAPILKFWERCKLFLMPAKHQPDYAYLRHVPLRKIHLFTTTQIICLAILWILKSTVAAIIFPVMVGTSISYQNLLWGHLQALVQTIPGVEEEGLAQRHQVDQKEDQNLLLSTPGPGPVMILK